MHQPHTSDLLLLLLLTDPKLDTSIKFGSHTVVVPQGKPLTQPQYSNSSFSQTEYLIYKESQVRLRYLLKFKYGGHHW